MRPILRTDRSGIAVAAIVIIVIVIAVVLLLAFFVFAGTWLSNQSCPSGECGNTGGTNPPIPFTVSISGALSQPCFGPTSIVNGAMKASATNGPTAVFLPPALFESTFDINFANLQVTFPSGKTYKYGQEIPIVKLTVGNCGSDLSGFTSYAYWTGPTGAYSASVNIVAQQTGCVFGCAPIQVTVTASWTL